MEETTGRSFLMGRYRYENIFLLGLDVPKRKSGLGAWLAGRICKFQQC